MKTPRWSHRWSPAARVSTLLPSTLLTALLIASPAWPAGAREDGKRLSYAPGTACELTANRGSHARTQDRERTHRKPVASQGQKRRSLGMASYYGPGFANRPTANGERFDPRAMTAAHRSLPFGTRVRVTNLENGRQVVVRINDRGPYRKGRVLDLSRAAARKLGFLEDGVAHVRIEVLKDKKARRNRDHLTDDMQASRESATRTRSKSRA